MPGTLRRRLPHLLLGAALLLVFPLIQAANAAPVGEITQLGTPPSTCVSETGSAGVCADGTGLGFPTATAVSRDGKSVYVASQSADSVAVFSRNTTTGALTQLAGTAGCVSETGAGGCADGTGLDGAIGVAVSADGKSVYVTSETSDAVAAFSRQTTTTGGTLGKLTQLPGTAGCVSATGAGGCDDGTGLDGAIGVAVSADNKSVYVASSSGDAVAVFFRQTTTTGGLQGKLFQLSGTAACVSETGAGGCADGAGLDGAIGVVVSADNKTVYVTSETSDAVAAFSRNSTIGALTQLAGTAGCVSETGAGGCADGAGLDGAIGVAVSADNKSVYVASSSSDAVAVLSRQTTTTGGLQGKLTQLAGTAGCVSETGAGGCADGAGLDGAVKVAVSADSKSVYVTSLESDAVAAFSRQTTTTGGLQGKLTQLAGTAGCVSETGAGGCADGIMLGGPIGVAVSADSKSVYVTSALGDAVAVFSRQTTTTGGLQGKLSQLGRPPSACISQTGFSHGVCADGIALAFPMATAVSKDGKSVYVASSVSGAVAVFSRNLTTGALTQLAGTAGCVSETGAGGCADGAGLGGAFGVAVSADNKTVFVASVGSDAVAVFSRSTTTGALTQLPGTAGCVSETGAGGCADGTGLDGASGVAVSADNKSVYVTSAFSDAVAVFSRQTTTTGGLQGKLTQLAGTAGCVSETGAGGCADGTGLDGAFKVAVSPDNKTVYVASVESDAVAAFSRQTTTTGGLQGKLTQLAGTAGCVSETGAGGCADGTGLDFASGVAVSPDNKSVYVASSFSDAVAAFSRQTTTTGGLQGKLTQLAGTAGCVSETGAGSCADGIALDGPRGVAVSPDSRSVYVTSEASDAVAAFSRQTTTTGGLQGKLTQLAGTAACVSDTGAGGCADGTKIDGPAGVAVSPDNKSVYTTSATFGTGAIAVFARSLGGGLL